MHLGLEGKVILVAGGSRGLGLGIVEACLGEGAKVAITARGAEALEVERVRLARLYGPDRVLAVSGDMRDTRVIEAAIAQVETDLGPILGAVANVGISPAPSGVEIDDETWDAGFAQNLHSAFRLARAALRPMMVRGEGAMLMISSIAGLGVPSSAYLRAKVAQEALIKASPIPYSIVRSTQFIPFIEGIVQSAVVDGEIRLPPALMQPIDPADVVAALVQVAVGPPLNGVLEIAGPEVIPMNVFGEEYLRAKADPRRVTIDPSATYFGAALDLGSLVPGAGARLGSATVGDWFAQLARA